MQLRLVLLDFHVPARRGATRRDAARHGASRREMALLDLRSMQHRAASCRKCEKCLAGLFSTTPSSQPTTHHSPHSNMARARPPWCARARSRVSRVSRVVVVEERRRRRQQAEPPATSSSADGTIRAWFQFFISERDKELTHPLAPILPGPHPNKRPH